MLFFHEKIKSLKNAGTYLGDQKDQLLLSAQADHQTLDYQVVQVHLKVLSPLLRNKQ